jgi:hypothetical protein
LFAALPIENEAQPDVGEQRLDVKGPVRLYDEVNLIAGYVDTRHRLDNSFTRATTMPDLNAVASMMVGVSSVLGTGIEIGVAVGLPGDNERDMRRQIREIVGE